jgi:putative membrane protein
MQKRFLTTAAALGLLVPAALAGAAQGQAPVGPVSTAQVSNDTDVLYMEVATMSNLTEITTSQLALRKSSDAKVRAYAQQMITEHTRAQAELNAIAAAKGVKLADKPGADQRLLYNRLTTLSGAQFDAAYKNVQLSGHQMTLDLTKAYRTVAKDQQAAAYAAKIQPAVAMHLEMAKELPGG